MCSHCRKKKKKKNLLLWVTYKKDVLSKNHQTSRVGELLQKCLKAKAEILVKRATSGVPQGPSGCNIQTGSAKHAKWEPVALNLSPGRPCWEMHIICHIPLTGSQRCARLVPRWGETLEMVHRRSWRRRCSTDVGVGDGVAVPSGFTELTRWRTHDTLLRAWCARRQKGDNAEHMFLHRNKAPKRVERRAMTGSLAGGARPAVSWVMLALGGIVGWRCSLCSTSKEARFNGCTVGAGRAGEVLCRELKVTPPPPGQYGALPLWTPPGRKELKRISAQAFHDSLQRPHRYCLWRSTRTGWAKPQYRDA